MDLARIKFLSGILSEAKAPADADMAEEPDMDADDAAPAPKEEKAEKAPKEEKSKKDVPPAVAKFVTSGLAKKMVSAGLATDPEEDEGASLIAIAMPFYDAGYKAGQADKK
jgi:hypothetical protein